MTTLKVMSSRADNIDSYEKELAYATRAAYSVACLHAVCNFLGYCILAWSTVVLLGGSVSSLNIADFYTLSSLLLLVAGRLASALFSIKLVKTALISLSQNPLHIKLEDDQSRRAWVVRLLALFGQVVFILPSIALPVYRLNNLPQNTGADNLPSSLPIFYVLVLSNAAVASLALLCSALVLKSLYHPVEQSTLRYYDEVLQRSLENGVPYAGDFDFFGLVYNLMGRDFSRNVQPLTIRRHHRRLIRYLYAHRHGIDMVLLFLDWPNCFVQQAAACMIGFWMDEKSNGLPVKLPATVMTKLADKLGTGQVGWTAANSVDRVAKWDPDLLLNTKNSRGVHIVDTLIDLVNPSTSRSLVFVRVLVSLYKGLDYMNKPEEFVRNLKQTFESKELVTKLKEMLQGSKVQRLRVLAGYLLMKMKKLEEEDGAKILNIIPDRDRYFYRSEVYMLDDLRRTRKLPPVDWSKIQSESFSIREEEREISCSVT